MALKISIGIPVKNEVENIPQLRSQIPNLIDSPEYSQVLFEILVNDNLSVDGSTQLLEQWKKEDSRVTIFQLQQPLEFQETIIDLMQKATGDSFALLQSDLQDPVHVLKKLIDTWLFAPDFIVAGCVVEKDEFFQFILQENFSILSSIFHRTNNTRADFKTSTFCRDLSTYRSENFLRKMCSYEAF